MQTSGAVARGACLLLRRQEIQIVESGDDFATGDELLEISAAVQGTILEELLPEAWSFVNEGTYRREEAIFHANPL